MGAIYQPREELVKEISINKIEPKTEPNLPNEDGVLKTTNTNGYSESDKNDTIHKENDPISTKKEAKESQDSTEEPMEVNFPNSIYNFIASLKPWTETYGKMRNLFNRFRSRTNLLAKRILLILLLRKWIT